MLGPGIVLAGYLMNSITRPLRRAETMARAIADMDLCGAPQSSYCGDETGLLLHALDCMPSALQGTLRRAARGGRRQSTASSRIASGNVDLCSRTEQTASNLLQTAGSTDKLTGTVTQTAESARSASQLASAASETAAKDGSVVSQAVSTTNEITRARRRSATSSA